MVLITGLVVYKAVSNFSVGRGTLAASLLATSEVAAPSPISSVADNASPPTAEVQAAKTISRLISNTIFFMQPKIALFPMLSKLRMYGNHNIAASRLRRRGDCQGPTLGLRPACGVSDYPAAPRLIRMATKLLRKDYCAEAHSKLNLQNPPFAVRRRRCICGGG